MRSLRCSLERNKGASMSWMNSFLASLLAIGLVALGTQLDRRRRQRRKARLARPEIARWEEEGGAVGAEPGSAAEKGREGCAGFRPS